MDWDVGRVSSMGMESERDVAARDALQTASPAALQRRLLAFLRGFRVGPLFYYREQLLANYRRGHFYFTVSLSHLSSFDQELQDLILKSPKDHLPLLENAAKDMLAQLLVRHASDSTGDATDAAGVTPASLPDIQAVLSSDQAPVPLRHVHSQEINRLVKVPGIIISATRVRTKCVSATLRCKNCGNTKRVAVSGMGGVAIPRMCDRNREDEEAVAAGDACPQDSYLVLPDRGDYVDQQTLKLQENPEVVPTGEMPRNLALIADRHLVDRASPGTRVSVVGITSVVNAGGGRNVGAVAIRTLYLRVIGIEIDEEGAGRAKATFSPAEEEKFHEMARDPKLYEKLAASIAPSIYGDYTVNMKKAIACLLVGGSRKRLPDGMILRGDINVLLLGDPSTAKSQFLKFTEKIAPVGVYTSGKGSSAAGLTASVIRDAKGEFYLEGGAMVLADGGVVCIDEFDKMRESDRVAIHEAMEQQTISIAKAGITTILNSRASVLAAANPVFGRYDDMRSASENIDLMSTILSRFDMIFIVRDIQDDARDRQMAAHVVRMHTNSLASAAGKTGASEKTSSGGEFEPWVLKKFITYCRTRCAPRLSVGAAQALQDFYVGVRDDVRRTQGGETTIPVTVRQLEALVRISESLAKMHLLNEATREHVQEAVRLFSVSTMNAAKDGGTQGLFGGFHEKAQEVEQSINRTLRIGTRVETSALYSRLEAQGYNPNAIQRAIRAMVQKGSLRQLSQYKFVSRVK
ncbi:hypothetical protein BBJ28_00000446 [Nothophytophthora sp. Chile5]|nr:hypothetical protein BBJ28_00000446 [Nothophytophthora sp. Chile5]